ncbi:TniQ family protein [Actinomadura bangladeshensis]|uniref:TniQ family protein n=1 Tax=Actinomadura bangladeshensis TaxID=453573 RepID=A0A6L9Q8Y6_9ACTN|nr:TniQ family protein [Actinomadura bangladeshensis]NEA21960.1 TniQ family protein [Actinomadura bangladeshensis]
MTEMSIRRLPRSLAPLPDEELTGYLLRLAHRLEQPPALIATRTGLADQGGRVLSRFLLKLEPERTARFAHACQLTQQETDGLCLASFGERYPPLDLTISEHKLGIFLQQTQQVPALLRWVFTQHTRYCPHCLAGDDGSPGHLYNGIWKKTWRLPLVSACPIHNRLLVARCPECSQPAHTGPRAAGLIPQSNELLHPAQCRAPSKETEPDRRKPRPPCGHRLDAANDEPRDTTTIQHVLDLQQRLFALLQPDAPETVSSIGDRTRASRYFLDLRLACFLISYTWPQARHLESPPPLLDSLDDHLQRQHSTIRDLKAKGKRPRSATIFSSPPADPAACSALLAIAEQILGQPSREAAGEHLRPLLSNVVDITNFRTFVSRAKRFCSPAFSAVIETNMQELHPKRERGANLLSRNRAGLGQPYGWREHHRQSGHLVIAPIGDCRFGHQHVPQYMTDAWIERHFPAPEGINPSHLRRTAAIRLVQMSNGGSVATAGKLLGINSTTSASSTHTVRVWESEPANAKALATAIHAFRDELNAASDLIDYGRRRASLTAWEIPAPTWEEMISRLNMRHRNRSATPSSIWDDRKRRAASVIIWATITCGDHRLAPLLQGEARKANGAKTNMLTYDTQQIRYRIRTSHKGPTATLATILHSYAHEMAAKIDRGETS